VTPEEFGKELINEVEAETEGLPKNIIRSREYFTLVLLLRSLYGF
jgi:hypothetical protein